ncbi:MAG: hypothetical protein KKG99_08955 [Bacteroidetes bacterium]|nr:hypothetical protein [Bacteroidota bacterium]
MDKKPKFDFIYLLIVIGIIFLLVKHQDLSTENLILYLVFFDIVVGFVLIGKGFFKWDMSYIFTGAFCALCAYYSYKEMNDSSLLFLIIGGLVGIGNHVRKSFKKYIG